MKQHLKVAGTLSILLGLALIVFVIRRAGDEAHTRHPPHPAPRADVTRPDVAAPALPDAPGQDAQLQRRADASREAFLAALDAGPQTAPGRREPARVLYLQDIDDIKHEIYAREIESVDRLHLLDELVQTGDTDTRAYWNRDWSGVDDWKDEQNGFSLQRTEDGTLIFHPDEATMALYSFYENLEPYEYDPVKKEFVSEIDYYGKPIRNVLKFIKDDTLVMMTISGDKVDLNIYGEGAPTE